jgi:hypothetical protein
MTLRPLQAAILDLVECPIAMGIMEDPVVARNGVTYNRPHIEAWFAKRKVCPITGKYMYPELIPNHKVKNLIAALNQADDSVLYKSVKEAMEEYDEKCSFNPAPVKTSKECSTQTATKTGKEIYVQTEHMGKDVMMQTEHMGKDAMVQTDPIATPKVVWGSTTYQYKTVMVKAPKLLKDQLSDAQIKVSNLTRTVQKLKAENKKFNDLVYEADSALGTVQSENERLKMEISRLKAYSNAHYMTHQIRDMSAEIVKLKLENAKLKEKVPSKDAIRPASKARPSNLPPRGSMYAR